MSFNVLLNDTNQRRDIVKAAPPDLFLRQFPEPSLHHVQPGTGCRREMEIEARMPTEPGLYPRMLMGTVIVYDQMKLQGRRGFGIDLLDKPNGLLVPMPRHAVPDDFYIAHTERCN